MKDTESFCYDRIRKQGLTSELFDYSELIDGSLTRKCYTYCSSLKCTHNCGYGRLGRLVNTGANYLEVCPNCGSSTYLAFKSIID
jgi:hypothetical protein